MKSRILICAVVILFSGGTLKAEQPAYKPGAVLVRFANDFNATSKNIILRSVLGGSTAPVKREYSVVKGLTLVELPTGVSVENAVSSLKQSSSILYAEPVYNRKFNVIPGDARFDQLWAMRNVGQFGGTIDADIDAPEAWDVNTGSKNIIVAVADTGVDYTHPDLAANMWHNPGEIADNLIDDDGDGFIDDVYGCDTGDDDGNPIDDTAFYATGHGTHIAGTIGAVGNNGIGVTGVCWNISLMAIKMADAEGVLTIDSEIQGIQYAMDKGAKVINASWSGPQFSQAEYDIIAAAKNKGILLVAAAGNDGFNNDTISAYPASYNLDNIISVMATSDTDQMAYYSNYGLVSVDIAAPGGAQQTDADPRGIFSTLPNNTYGNFQGTSMAAPHVTGACALIFSIVPNLPYSQVKEIILNTSDKIVPGLCETGGRLNLAAAAHEAAADSTPPESNPTTWLIPPTATGLHTVTMEAAALIDRSGVEYYYECVNDVSKNSGWRATALYSFTTLSENTTYGFRFKARDKSTNQNETDWSNVIFTTTASGSDTLSPAPNPTQWQSLPQPNPHTNKIIMVAKGIDESTPIQFQFEETTLGFNSGWRSSASFAFPETGSIDPDHTYRFICKSRDKNNIETQWSVAASARMVASSQIIHVFPGSPRYPTIQSAIDVAANGDIVEIAPGTYYGTGNYNLDFDGRAITVRSLDPENPEIVAATVVDCNYLGRGFVFNSGEDRNSVLAGITISKGMNIGENGTFPVFFGEDGGNGKTGAGGGILCGNDPNTATIELSSSPTIRNCVLIGCFTIGGLGMPGAPGQPGTDYDPGDPNSNPPVPPTQPTQGSDGGNGGHGGSGKGGAIYCSQGSNPLIQNCIISGCFVTSGIPANGGDGSNGGEDQFGNLSAGGDGGYGGDINGVQGGGICVEEGSKAQIVECNFVDCAAVLDIFDPGLGGAAGNAGIPGRDGRIVGGGFGGGAFYGMDNVSAEISATTFIRNYASDNGGGVYFQKNNSQPVILSGCNFSDNTADSNGGGIFYERGTSGAKVYLINCTMTGNLAGQAGGALKAGDVDYSPTAADINIQNSSFVDNTALEGGALFIDKTILAIDNSNFTNNSAYEGGGINGYDCQVNITSSRFNDNNATNAITGLGGGIAFWHNTTGTITDTIMNNNSAGLFGGAVFMDGWSDTPLTFTNCLITNNNAYYEGGGLSCNIGAWAKLTNCTIAYNSSQNMTYGSGGGVSSSEYCSWIMLENSILWQNSATYGSQIAAGTVFGSSTEPGGGFAWVDVSYCDIDGGESQTFIENPSYNSVYWWDGNIDEDPLFVNLNVGDMDYYLSQISAGQLTDSACVDAGDRPANDLVIGHMITTRTDLVQDSGIIDMGYHYEAGTPQKYLLSIEVAGGNGRLEAISNSAFPFDIKDNNIIEVNQGLVATLTAIPDPCFTVFQWINTDDDTSKALSNTVTMNSNKNVVVSFQPDGIFYLDVTIEGEGTLEIIDGDQVTTVSSNINDPNRRTLHKNGAIVKLNAEPDNLSDVVVWTGTDNDYVEVLTNTVTMLDHRTVTVKFHSPRVLFVGGDGNYPNIQMAIDDAQDGDIVMLTPGQYTIVESSQDNPFLFINKDITLTSSIPESPLATSIIGRIDVRNVSRRCKIQGLTIRDSTYWGDSIFGSGELFIGDAQGTGADGGYGGETRGAGITLNGSASPTVRNCIFFNCVARGIHGGNGASGLGPDGWSGNGGPGGRALGGAVYCGQNGNPLFENCSFIDNTARGGDGGNGAQGGATTPPGHGGAWGDKDAPWWEYDVLDYWKYSGYGGAVYCDDGSTAEFTNCTFEDNNAIGGSCGISGANPSVSGWPYSHYRIQAFGGAVYASTGSSPTFTDCNFVDNTADIDGWPTHRVSGNTISAYPTISYGGAIAFENGANPLFENCTFQENLATVGGAIWQDESYPEINDSNFIRNSALHGGAILLSQGTSWIDRSRFVDNRATFDAAQGGAIAALGANAEILDCNISNNRSSGSGGGIYISSKDVQGTELPGDNSLLIKNCLIVGNIADVNGGGISANWYSDPNIVNCTILNNKVGGMGLGGGVLSSYGSFVNIINSIIWENQGGMGANGAQIAVNSGPKYGPIPAAIKVSYSDIQGSNDPNAWVSNINALDVVFSLDTTGSMFDDINAVKVAARQITNAVADQFADVRFAVSTYRDYPEPNYGSPGDWPYRDEVRFTTDPEEVIDGIQPIETGGGNDQPESVYTALMHCIDANALKARLTANDEAGFIESDSPGLGNWRQGDNVLRVIILMGDASPHEPEPFTDYVLDDIVTAADGANPIHVVPVLIGGDLEASNYFRAIATETGGTVVQAPDADAVVNAFIEAIGLLSEIATPIYVDPEGSINWDPNTFIWQPDSHNINKDPCFVAGYFLSQIVAGQLVDSACVNAGNSDAVNLGLDKYTTRTDSVSDIGIVDMGYHYPLFTPPQYRLDFNAVEGNTLTSSDIEPNGGLFNWFTNVHLKVKRTPPENYQILWTGTDDDNSVEPNNTVLMDKDKKVTVAFVKNVCDLTVEILGPPGGGTVTVEPDLESYPRGSKVTITAHPAAGYRVEEWIGTDDDSSYGLTNTVTMSGDKTVTVVFSLPKTRTVPGDFTSIQSAVNAARSGDIVSIASGVYNTPGLVIDKEITITSTNPDDPCVVAMTVIDGNGIASSGVIFGQNTTPQTIFNGITIANTGYTRVASPDGDNPGDPGGDGNPAEGGGMRIYGSPTIKNCIIRDCNIFGGNAGNGSSADATTDAGHGGWGGWAKGAGIYIVQNAAPTIINTTITNCTVTGGNGGNGGNSSGTWSDPGYRNAANGGNWSDGLLWETWGYVGDYRYYSGYGGGVYCAEGSAPTFIACNITNNIARGGLSGIGGTEDAGIQIPMPDQSYRIPSFGGGVYCAANSRVTFEDCNINNNTVPKPDITYHLDPYLGHGGGIAFEETASIRLKNCNINDNTAAVGGGIFWAGGAPEVIDSEISGNIAYVGGGIYGTESSGGKVRGCTLNNNFAGIMPADVDQIVGQGGAIFSSAMSTRIIDCVFTGNVADSSGGGIYVFGPADDIEEIRNCLFTGNEGGRDGGAISSNWGAIVYVDNCTIYDNRASATFGEPGRTGFGGGLYCSYGATTDINNSIFRNNIAVLGNQIALETGFYFDPYCGSINVSYSDIMDGQAGIHVGNGCASYLTWGLGNIDVDPLFIDETGSNFHLKQRIAGQSVDSPCVNAGGNLAVNLGFIRYSSATTGVPDFGIVDMGYRYSAFEPCRRADLVVDNIVNFEDFAIFAKSWLEENCDDADGWCAGSDLSLSGAVEMSDLGIVADCWLEPLLGDTTAPTPNPMTWETVPHVLSPTSIAMTATTAIDASGEIEYEFNETSGLGHSSVQADPCYIDTGLDSLNQYCYKVRAHDRYGNVTAWSLEECVSGLADPNAPEPPPLIVWSPDVNNIGWSDPNVNSAQFQYYPEERIWWHRIIANVAGITDDSGGPVEIRFNCRSNDNYSSINKAKDPNGSPLHIYAGQPVSLGSRGEGWRVTFDNSGNYIVYDVKTSQVGGSGIKLFWEVCAYDESGNEACSNIVEIVWPPIQ